MEAHRIAVISDTHGLLRPEVVEQLKSCEAILHAGDFGKPDLLSRLKEICPVYAVRGNVDRDWAGDLPEDLEITLFGFRFYIIHDRKQIRKDLSDMDAVIFGHSHQYEEKREGRTLYINPGSCGAKRFRLPITMAILTLFPEEHRIEQERIEFTSAEPKASYAVSPHLSDKDMYKLIRRIMKEVDSGRSVAEIAARNHVNEEFAEQVCRMYMTHPGVDVDGILDRLERRNL